jgi:hypothetical protein
MYVLAFPELRVMSRGKLGGARSRRQGEGKGDTVPNPIRVDPSARWKEEMVPNLATSIGSCFNNKGWGRRRTAR